MIRTISGASVVGFSRSSFQSNDRTVNGYNVNFTYPLTAEGAEGLGVGSLWLSKKSFDSALVDIGSVLVVARVRSGDRFRYELVETTSSFGLSN